MPSLKPLLAISATRAFSSSTGKMLSLLMPNKPPVRTFYNEVANNKSETFAHKVFNENKKDITITIGEDSNTRKADMNISYCSKEDKFKLTFPGYNYYFDVQQVASMLKADKIPFEHDEQTTPYEISVDNAHNEQFSKFIHSHSESLGFRSGGAKFVAGYLKVVEDYQSRSICP